MKTNLRSLSLLLSVALLAAGMSAQCTTPTGTVQINNNQYVIAASVPLVNGAYSVQQLGSSLGVGQWQLTTVYSGDAYCAASTSTQIVQVVNSPPSPTPTSTSLQSSQNPALTTDTITLSGSVTPQVSSPAAKAATVKK